MFNSYAKSELEMMVGENEKIIWQGKPNMSCFILEGIFNPLLPFAIVWCLFDSMIIALVVGGSNNSGTPGPFFIFLLIFLLIHMMPVWIYLFGVFRVFRRYKCTEYIVTDKGVYVSDGVFSYTCNMKPFTKFAHVAIHRGIIDRILGVGDVVLTNNNNDNDNDDDLYSLENDQILDTDITIADIKDYREVFEVIKNLQDGTYIDTMYQNDLSTDENQGYRTEYNDLN